MKLRRPSPGWLSIFIIGVSVAGVAVSVFTANGQYGFAAGSFVIALLGAVVTFSSKIFPERDKGSPSHADPPQAEIPKAGIDPAKQSDGPFSEAATGGRITQTHGRHPAGVASPSDPELLNVLADLLPKAIPSFSDIRRLVVKAQLPVERVRDQDAVAGWDDALRLANSYDGGLCRLLGHIMNEVRGRKIAPDIADAARGLCPHIAGQ